MQLQSINGPPVPRLAREFAGNQAYYQPILLKQVLAANGIRQDEWCAALRLRGRRRPGISQPMGSMILNWGIWPKRTPVAELKAQTVAFLRRRGVPEDALTEALWQELPWNQAGPLALRQLHKRKPRAATSGAEMDHPIGIEQEIQREMLSQNAKRQFKLFRDPFQDDVRGPEDVFLSDSARLVREGMFLAAKHGGFVAVIGESGAGKSVLRRDLIERIRRDDEPITCIMPRTLDKTRLTAGAICEAIIGDMSSEPPKRSLEAKGRQVERLLTGSSRAGNRHVLLIEEAHDLAIPTLKYLKRFWEMEDGFQRLLSIILIGQPELKDKLNERLYWEAREVIRRVEVMELEPLNGDLEQYLAMKFKRFGKALEDVFAQNAFDAIRERLTQRSRNGGEVLSMLYPLVVNNMVVRCMNLAAEIGESRINADIVKGV